LVDRFVWELKEACEYRTRNVCLPGICLYMISLLSKLLLDPTFYPKQTRLLS